MGRSHVGQGCCAARLRSTFDWRTEQTGYSNEMSEMALAHTVPDKVEVAYRRGDMLEKRRRMMADWAAFCAGTVAVEGSNVITPNRRDSPFGLVGKLLARGVGTS
ncbi:hypothetical protein [Bradyrhizobium sp. 195]|uniref:hypothetical protein n=1 Tax=Bradyrhizobium sp. 195 TaxID=2782662 RepID=UPI00200173CE|nr:hypothetical protein [Bradyrhizobium sp. 195]UPK28370.1 hypothetical protein IVB26_08125 [Bradyrhizobium sp. 195]